MANEVQENDRGLRSALLARLYRAYLEEGLYRGVIAKKELSRELGAQGVVLERNLEYLLERRLIRMHKIEDLISITTEGIDWVENRGAADSSVALLGRIEKLLEKILSRLEEAG
ncbi:MAG: hypothetical protein JXQ83_14070 [Candidatus Glassbacteria bacterium]|nr:hypothetical protein [Candidatus Glassbacteria bacterium]